MANIACRRSAWLVAAILLVSAAVAGAAPGRQVSPADSSGSTRLLDVPYLLQTEDLCGGAALAMLMRYWGELRVYPEDFSSLVDSGASGIPTDVLATETARRGWRSFPINVDAASGGSWMREQIDRGRPVIALVEVRPGRYHYVVIVGWTGEQVIAHDPAHGPFRVMSRTEFDHLWALAGRWALLVLPPDDQPAASVSLSPILPADARSAPETCGPLVQEMVQLARAGAVGEAATGLLAATRLCPDDPAAWRELSGVRFLQSRWSEASTSATRAALLDPGDEPGWDLLATSRFLSDEPDEALEAWNRIGRPSVDLVRVDGAGRTRHPVIAALVDLPPRSLLTVEAHRKAARRLHELPSAAVTRLSYRPIADGLAEIEAAVVERSTAPHGVLPVVATAARAWLLREMTLDLAAPSGSGELWTVAWRWREARPRVAFALAVPSPSWLPGITTIEGAWERQAYATPSADRPGTTAVHVDERRRAAIGLADWATSRVRWQVGAALERWGQNSYFSVDSALDLRILDDRMSIGLETAASAPRGSGGRFARAGASTAWRSTREADRPLVLMSAGLVATSAGAPFGLWPGAGTGDARTPLLRAHPLLDAGVIGGPVFGRRMAHANVEYQHPIRPGPTATIRLAVFADTAQAWRRMGDAGPSVWHTDVGTGMRLALPGHGGSARLDVARGLRDGRVVVSAGWQAPWPMR